MVIVSYQYLLSVYYFGVVYWVQGLEGEEI